MKVFLDSSVIIAALLSSQGGSAQILEFCEARIIQGYISVDVEREIEEVVQRKFPEATIYLQKILRCSRLKIIKKLELSFFKKALQWIDYRGDAKILAAAKQANVDYLLTLDLRHFLKDPEVAQKAKLNICTPGDFLKIFRRGFN